LHWAGYRGEESKVRLKGREMEKSMLSDVEPAAKYFT
jgi:hypothetical protein